MSWPYKRQCSTYLHVSTHHKNSPTSALQSFAVPTISTSVERHGLAHVSRVSQTISTTSSIPQYFLLVVVVLKIARVVPQGSTFWWSLCGPLFFLWASGAGWRKPGYDRWPPSHVEHGNDLARRSRIRSINLPLSDILKFICLVCSHRWCVDHVALAHHGLSSSSRSSSAYVNNEEVMASAAEAVESSGLG